MLILIEGIDRTGKSTLATRLAVFTGGAVIHFGRPGRHPINEYAGELTSYRPARDTFILDRGHVGESVWPHVFDRPSDMDEATRRWLNMWFMSRGAVLIHAQRDVDADTAHEFELAGEPITALGDIMFADELFKLAVADSGLPAYPYRHGGWPGAALHDAARRAIVAGELLELNPRYVGSHAPRLLIVNGWEERAMPLMPYEGTPGAELLRELDCWRQCGLVNCRRPDRTGDEHLRGLWHALGRPRVLTFGGAAADTVDGWGCEHESFGPIKDFRRLSPGSLRETIGRSLEHAH